MLFNNDWEVLQALYRCKNITLASKQLYISQPALTKKIMRIEKELEINIVIRTAKGVVFTPEGERLLQYAENSIGQYNDFKNEISLDSNNYIGTLKLGSASAIAQYELPDLIKQFTDQYPRIDLRLQCGTNSYISEMVYSQKFHAGFVRDLSRWNVENFVFNIERAYLVSKKPVDINCLPDVPQIAVEREQINKMLIDNWWYDRFAKPPKVMITVPSGNVSVAMIRAGLGYGILIDRHFYENENLLSVPLSFLNGSPLMREDYVIYNKASENNALVQLFLDFSRNYFIRTNEDSIYSANNNE